MLLPRFGSAVAAIFVLHAAAHSSGDSTGSKPAQPLRRLDRHGDSLPAGTLARLGTIRLRPGAAPNHLLFSRDGQQVICFSGGYGTGNALVYFDAVSGAELKRQELRDSRILALTITPEGRGLAVVLLVPGGRDYYLWEFTDPKASVPRPDTPLQPRISYDDIRFAISPDGRWVASAGRNSGEAEKPLQIRPWTTGRKLLDLEPVQTWTLPGTAISEIVFTHDSKAALAACRRKDESHVEFRFFDLAKGDQPPSRDVSDVEYTAYAAYTFALAPKRLLALGIREKKGQLLDLAGGKKSRPLPFPDLEEPGKNATLSVMAFNSDGRYLAAGDWEGWLRLWDVEKERVVWQSRGPKYGIRLLAFSPDGRRLASSSSDGLIRLWDVATGKETCPLPALQGSPGKVAVSHDGRSAVTAIYDGQLHRWSLVTGELLRQTKLDYPFHDLDLAPGSDDVIVAHGNRLDRWDLAKNQLEPIRFDVEPFLPEQGDSFGRRFQFAADGKMFISMNKHQVSLWDWPQRKLRRRWTLADTPEEQPLIDGVSLAVTKDGGRALVLAWHYQMRQDFRQFVKTGFSLWDVHNGKKLPFSLADDNPGFGLHYNNFLTFTPDDEGFILCMFAHVGYGSAAGHESLRWIDLATGSIRRRFITPPNPRNSSARIADHVAFSPDGRTLASAERDHTVVLYEAASGLPRRVLSGHRNDVRRLAFTPDGRQLVTVSADLTGLVWDLSLAQDGPKNPSAPQLAAAWNDLADSADGRKVHRAMATLAADPNGAVALIRRHVEPARGVEPKSLAGWLADLDSPNFAARNKAFTALDQLGDGVLGALRDELKKNPNLEMSRRLAGLIAKHDPANLPPERLRTIRALEILEHLGTPAAQELLVNLAQGNPAASLTRAAHAARERLRER